MPLVAGLGARWERKRLWMMTTWRAIKHDPKSVTFPDSEDVPSAIKNISTAQGMSRQWFGECHVNKNDTSTGSHVDGVGEASVFSLKTSHQLKTGGLCTVPSPGVDQSQSQRRGQGQHIMGPREGPPKKGSQQVTT